MLNRLPIENLEQGGKIIIITRDPRDAIVSLPFGSYFDYYNSWEKALKENKKLKTLIVHYEHLKTNGLKELQRIQDFIEVCNSEERLKHILDRFTVKQMKTDVDTGKVETSLKDVNGKSVIYRKELLQLFENKKNIKGDHSKIGDWKNHFTVAQSEYFDKVLEERFENSIFNL